MPLDAICLRAVLHELRPQLIGARIDKVQQPARDQIVLLLRGNLRLLLNAGANQPRIQLTNILRDNPAQPPMFCMLLRKHLVGARVLSIEQPDLERMVILTLQCTDEFGEISQKQLVLECMGRRSNLVLLDAQGRIVECLRRVDADLSATRQLLPGLFYHLPTPLDKLSLLSQEEDSLALAQRGGEVGARPLHRHFAADRARIRLPRGTRDRRALRRAERYTARGAGAGIFRYSQRCKGR